VLGGLVGRLRSRALGGGALGWGLHPGFWVVGVRGPSLASSSAITVGVVPKASFAGWRLADLGRVWGGWADLYKALVLSALRNLVV